MHDTCGGLASDPYTGDILISGPNNVIKFPYEELNEKLATDDTSMKIDLGFQRGDGLYSANNVIDSIMSPTSPTKTGIELKKLSGINIFPNTKVLTTAFTDMINRLVGYIIQERNLNGKELFAQILYNDLAGNADRNLDTIAVFIRGLVDSSVASGSWLLPFTSTKAWAEKHPVTNVTMPMPAPIPIRPPSWITNYGRG